MTLDRATTRLATALSDRYRLERELGQGGMATVYLAFDLRHDRRVAVKVLRPELAAVIGAERFLAEIKTTAALQHPHILPLFDSGQVAVGHDGGDGPQHFLFYVMPFVEGESLRDRLSREKQLPVEDAVRIAAESASALDYAHRHGVIHRDIKPENILLHDGQALVADFGIALAVSAAGGSRMTETGMSLGTPHYMSPEQAMGEREITAKSDVYALGCVTYEMLVGEPPFTGPTAQAVVARVVTEEPRSISLQRKTVPPHVNAAVIKALSKLPADRFTSAAAFAEALTSPGMAPRITTSIAGTPPSPARSLGPAASLAVAALLGLLVGVAGGRWIGSSGPAGSVLRFSINTASDQSLSGAPVGTIALAPDGSALVYVGLTPRGPQLFLRRLADLAATPISGTDGGLTPFLSPDGRWIAFFTGQGGVLKKAPVSGGASQIVQANSENLQAATWLDNETFLVTGSDGSLNRLNGDGSLTRIASPDAKAGETSILPVDVFPGGHAVLALGQSGGSNFLRALAIDLASGKRKMLLDGVAGVEYDANCLVWVQPDGNLLAAPFDTKRQELTGSAVTIAQGVRVPVGGSAQFTVSHHGSLAYVPEIPFDLALVDRTGRWQALADIKRRFHSPRFSPDGRQVAMDFSQQGSRDVWLLDLRQRALTRLTFDNTGHDPIWTPEGRRIAYLHTSNGNIGIFERNVDGSGGSDSVLVGQSNLTAGTITRDGKTMVVVATGEKGDFDLDTLSLTGTRSLQPLMNSAFNEAWPALSPDGRWLAYQSDESGQPEVYVRGFRGVGGKYIISQSGGSEPAWSRDGRELFYRGVTAQGTSLIAAALQISPEFRVLSRTPLFDVEPYEGASPHANYDVAPDGKGFVMVHQGQLSQIIVVQNWQDEVRQRGTK
jgi:serine/threonine-protein kinase